MIIVVAGVSGSGKTTVGAMLAGRLGWAFADGDAFHPAANLAKMRAGRPLTDADRQPWLAAISRWITERIACGQSGVVTCSALKRDYRQRLVAGRPQVRLVFLDVGHDVDAARLMARRGHFFPGQLLDSQFADLENPQPDEGALVVSAEAEPAQIVDAIIRGLRRPAASPAAANLPVAKPSVVRPPVASLPADNQSADILSARNPSARNPSAEESP
jgi:gluconokinase